MPTCKTNGLTPKISCSACGEVFTHHNDLGKLHNFTPTDISTDGTITYTCTGGCGYPFSCTYKAGLTEESVYNTIISMKSVYPDETPFDNSNTYFTKDLYPYVNFTGRGCAAFACELSDKAFGNLPGRYHFDFTKIRVGDIVRILDDQHSVIVLEVNGDEITIAEGNIGDAVLWGRKLKLSDPTVGWSYVVTRYPE